MHWTNVKVGASAIAVGLVLLCQAVVRSQEARTWTDKTGGFSIEAVLTSQSKTVIGLKTADGRLIKVPKSKLSQSDLDHLRSLATTPTKPSAPSASAAERMLSARLEGAPVAVNPEETLAGFLGRIGVPFFVDRASLNKIGLDQDVPINSDSEASSLSDQLDALLASKELTWYRLRTVLVVTSRESAERNAMETLAYRIPIPRNDASAVIDRIESVDPSSWESLGGPGTIAVLPGVVMIRQTGQVHRQLKRQLKLRSILQPYTHPLDNELVSVGMTEGTLGEFARQLETQLNRKVTVSDSATDEVRLTAKLGNVAATDALDLLLAQCNWEWMEDRNGLELVPDASARQRLEDRRVTIPPASPQLSSLIQNSVIKLVEPRSWAPLGGAGQIRHVAGNGFQISQTQPIFRKLDRLIAVWTDRR
jgi:hypothetical protein